MEANTLAKEASANQPMDEFDEVQYIPSIDIPEVLQVQNEENWMTPIISYLKDGNLLEGKDEARRLRVWSARYVLLNDVSPVFVTERGKLCVEGSPRRSLREPLRSQITYPQGRPCKILLANHPGRR